MVNNTSYGAGDAPTFPLSSYPAFLFSMLFDLPGAVIIKGVKITERKAKGKGKIGTATWQIRATTWGCPYVGGYCEAYLGPVRK